MKKLTDEPGRISIILPPHGNNPRNSEGDFIRLKDGRILYAFSYFHGETSDDNDRSDIRAIYSDDEGRSFYTGTEDGEARLLISAELYGEKNVMSVTLLRMQNGDIGLFYALKHSATGTDEYLLSRSRDECESFYVTTPILPGDAAEYHVVNNSRVERLSSGRLLVPSASRGNIGFFYSDDDGESWYRMKREMSLPFNGYSHTGLQEPGVIELPNGDLYVWARTDTGTQYEALSIDGLAHWFGPQPSRFTSPESPMEIARNPYTGRYYAVFNPLPIHYRWEPQYDKWITNERTPLAIVESPDGYNFDFEKLQMIEDDPTRGYCYPALFFPDKDTLLLAYHSGSSKLDGNWNARTTIRRIML